MSPYHLNKSFKLPILITYPFRNIILMDGNNCWLHSWPHTHSPRATPPLWGPFPAVRMARAGFRVTVSTVSAYSSLQTWTPSKPEGAMSSRLLASLNPGECVELCLKRPYSTDIWKLLESISNNWTHGQYSNFWSFLGNRDFSSLHPGILMLKTVPEYLCVMLHVTETPQN